MRAYHPILVAIALAIPAGSLAAEAGSGGKANSPGLDDYTSCAVYFRMRVGSMSPQYGRDLGPLADIERDKMNTAMSYARAQAKLEYGADKAEEKFTEVWRQQQAEMMKTINYNYDNIGELTYRYKEGCEKLINGPAPAQDRE